jgi:hypothetical protein
MHLGGWMRWPAAFHRPARRAARLSRAKLPGLSPLGRASLIPDEPPARPTDPIGAALAHLVSSQDASGSWERRLRRAALSSSHVRCDRTHGRLPARRRRQRRHGDVPPLSPERRRRVGIARGGGEPCLHHSSLLRSVAFSRRIPPGPQHGSFASVLGRSRRPVASASWGKFMLAVLGLYHWDGLHPIPPSFGSFPRAFRSILRGCGVTAAWSTCRWPTSTAAARRCRPTS